MPRLLLEMNELIAFFTSIDNQLLLLINDAHTPLMDVLMWHYSLKWIWLPFYVGIYALIIKRYSIMTIIAVSIFIVLLIICTDQCGQFLKHYVARPRPSHSQLEYVLHYVNGYHGGKYGLPSNHAANSAAFASFLTYVLRNRIWTAVLTVWSIIMGYSRIYLGVHYPSDVIAGFIIGAAIGQLFGYIWVNRQFIRQAMHWRKILSWF